MKIKFAKVNKNSDAKIPSKRFEDAGFDIYASFSEENMVIQPNETKMIPTGLMSSFPAGYVAILKERGSTGSRGIGQRCGVIDSGYRGEWFVPLTNHNTKPLAITKEENAETLDVLSDDYIVYPYKKAICQVVFFKIPNVNVKEVEKEDILDDISERGNGALGSSRK